MFVNNEFTWIELKKEKFKIKTKIKHTNEKYSQELYNHNFGVEKILFKKIHFFIKKNRNKKNLTLQSSWIMTMDYMNSKLEENGGVKVGDLIK